jgi:hypothetical protein
MFWLLLLITFCGFKGNNLFMKPINHLFKDFINHKAKRITLVMDNHNRHTVSVFYETFRPKEAKRLWDRFEFVFSPKHGSWLNMAAIELHVLKDNV